MVPAWLLRSLFILRWTKLPQWLYGCQTHLVRGEEEKKKKSMQGATAFLLSVNFSFASNDFISVDFEVPIRSMLRLCLDPQWAGPIILYTHVYTLRMPKKKKKKCRIDHIYSYLTEDLSMKLTCWPYHLGSICPDTILSLCHQTIFFLPFFSSMFFFWGWVLLHVHPIDSMVMVELCLKLTRCLHH